MQQEPKLELDDDLTALDRTALENEVKKLRAGIREHRDSSGHDLCWHHPKLWALLPEKDVPALKTIPERAEFLRRCEAYRADLELEIAVGRALG